MHVAGKGRAWLGLGREIPPGAAPPHRLDAEPDQLVRRLAWNSRRVAALGNLLHRHRRFRLLEARSSQTIEQANCAHAVRVPDKRFHGHRLLRRRIFRGPLHLQDRRWKLGAIIGVDPAGRSRGIEAIFGERRGGPVERILAAGFRTDALQGTGVAVRAHRPRRVVLVFDGVHHPARRVEELQPFAFLAEVLAENAGDRGVIELLETFAVPAQHEKAVGLDARARGEVELDSFGERPAAQIDGLAARIVQFDIFQIGNIIRRVVKDLVDHDAPIGHWRQQCEQQREEPRFSCEHSSMVCAFTIIICAKPKQSPQRISQSLFREGEAPAEP